MTTRKQERTLTGLALSVHMDENWLRGVDLFNNPALILCKLLTFQLSKMNKPATKADLSFSFHSVFSNSLSSSFSRYLFGAEFN